MGEAIATGGKSSRGSSFIGNAMRAAVHRFEREKIPTPEAGKADSVHEEVAASGHLPHGNAASGNLSAEEKAGGHIGY